MEIIVQFGKVSKEFALTLLFSLFPILFGSLVSAMWSSVDIKAAIAGNFSSGEVFMYTSAFLAPYILTRLKEGLTNLTREFCFYLFGYAFFAGAFMFVSVRLETLLSKAMDIDEQLISWVGYSIVFATLFIWYYSIWPNHRKSIDPIKVQKKQALDLEAATNKLVGKGAGNE
ncbi:hypothetical protein [Pseudomonas lactis]|uniref:hypothetical protein n=1 Tax=Pseudomonas lactis TaxID=1615674 RepID=UPI001473953B|nr:hypothetical protein [Pseudomonas lactis]NNA53896.1 hypothetical protein [Pseudomonas lactis]